MSTKTSLKENVKNQVNNVKENVKNEVNNFREQMSLLLAVLPGFKLVDISQIIGLKGGISCTVEFKDHKILDESRINEIKLNAIGKIIVAAIKSADKARQSLKEAPITFNSFTFTASIDASITLSFTPNYVVLKKEVEKVLNKKEAEKVLNKKQGKNKIFGMNINSAPQSIIDYGNKKVAKSITVYTNVKVENFVEQLRLLSPIMKESPFKFVDFSLMIGLETGISCSVEYKGDNKKWEESIGINKDKLNKVGISILSPIESAYNAIESFKPTPITFKSFTFKATANASAAEVGLKLSFTPNNNYNNNNDEKEEYTNKSLKSKLKDYGKKQIDDFLEQMRLLSPTMKDSGFKLDIISIMIGSKSGISCCVQNIDNNKTWDESRLNKDKLNKIGRIIVSVMKSADKKRQKYKESRFVFSSFDFEATNSPQLQLSFSPKNIYNNNDDQKENDK
eukprot:330790_1